MLVALLTLALFINYVDRGNLATSAPMIKDQLHLDEEQIGYLISAFYLDLCGGHDPRRFGPPSGLVPIVCWPWGPRCGPSRPCLPVLQAVSPCSLACAYCWVWRRARSFRRTAALLATYVPRESLGKANGTISFGYLVGPAIGTFIGGMLMARYGWRAVFIGFGAASFCWLHSMVPVLRSHSPNAGVSAHRGGGQPGTLGGFCDSAACRERLWDTSAGNVTSVLRPLLYAALPQVDVTGTCRPSRMAGVLGAASFINAVLCRVLAGWYADRWIRRGGSPTLVFKLLMNVCAVVSVAAMLGMVLRARGSCSNSVSGGVRDFLRLLGARDLRYRSDSRGTDCDRPLDRCPELLRQPGGDHRAGAPPAGSCTTAGNSDIRLPRSQVSSA
jgi:MFS family permease